MKENIKGIVENGKDIVSSNVPDSVVNKAEDMATKQLNHLENIVDGYTQGALREAEEAKNKLKAAKQTVQQGKDLANQASGYSHQIQGINGGVNRPENLSQNSTINTGGASISNAVAIANHRIFGVNHLVTLTLVVEGRELLNYKSFELKQSTKTHHEFKLELSHDALGVEETYRMDQSKDLLGKRLLVTINFKNIKEKPERYFAGVITDVSFEQAHGSRGYIVLTGYSPTILLDGAPNIQSFGGGGPIPLSAVVNKMLEEGYSHDGKYSYSIRSSNKINLSYTSQYNETHYNYLARMAEAYGEQFFYDGEILHFGDLPHGEKPIQLVYGRDVENIKIRQRVRHINRELYGYNSLNNERLNAGGNTKLEVKGTLAKAAYEKSEKLYTAPSLQQAPIKASTNQDIEAAQRGVVGSNALQVFVTTGTTSIPFLYPGCIVELDMLEAGTKETNHFTTLMITDVTHSVDALGKYKGTFEAVDADTGFIPRVEFTVPTAEQQIATVVSNKDPQGKGRVQVQFDWQYTDQSTEFIRVMTPDAGSSKEVGTNRGFVAIPEVGDQVVIGFVGNHPDRPFVMGGLFHGGTGAGGGANNANRSFSSKCGNALRFNDAAGSVTLHDKGTVNLLFDGKGNSSLLSIASNTIASTEKQTIQVGNVTSSKEKGIHIEGAPNSEVTMDDKGVIKIEAKEVIQLQVGKSIITIGTGGITIQGDVVNLIGNEMVQANGKGSVVTLNESKATIKAGEVDIN